MKVLIVDDHQPMRSLIRRIVFELPVNATIFECEDGEEAVEIFDKERPELILMDIMMKKMDGLSAIKKIRSMSNEAAIIVITQLPEADYKKDALKIGATDFLNKEELFRLIPLIKNLFDKKIIN